MNKHTGRIFFRLIYSGLICASSVLLGSISFGCKAAWSADNIIQAVNLYTAKRYPEAEAMLAKQIASGSVSTPEAHYYLATCYQHNRKFDLAKKEYQYIVDNFVGSQAAEYSQKALESFAPAALSTSGKSAASATTPAASSASTAEDFVPEEERIPYTRGVGGHFYVRATINGHSQEMMLDTGAETTVVNLSVWRALGFAAPSGPPTGIASGVAGSVGMWAQPAVVGLGKIKKNIIVHIADSASVPPLLGESFFGDLEYTMDGRSGYIHFFKKGHKSSLNAVPYNSIDIPFRHLGKNMLITAKFNGIAMDCYFDTGAFGILLGSNQMQELGLSFPENTRVGNSGGVGGLTKTYFFPIDRVEVGDLCKTHFDISVSSRPQSTPLIGQSFFGDRRYVIDNEKMLIRFAR